jgi:hypothetical protein
MNREQQALIIFFVLDFILLVGFWVSTTFNDQYALVMATGFAMLIAGIIISGIISALAFLRYGLRLPLKKSLIYTLCLFVLAFIIYSIGQVIVIKTGRN